MRIVEDEYNWKRADATVVVLEEGTENVEFENPLKIYRIRGEGEIAIYEDEDKSEFRMVAGVDLRVEQVGSGFQILPIALSVKL